MSPLWLGKAEPDGKKTRGEAAKGTKKVRRKRSERRSGDDRRRRGDRRRRKRDRHTRDLYRSDLDRHLWSWASSKTSRKKREQDKKTTERRRKVAGVVASAAGALGAAGISWFLYRKIRKEERDEDPISKQADLDEADFER